MEVAVVCILAASPLLLLVAAVVIHVLRMGPWLPRPKDEREFEPYEGWDE